VGAIFRTADGAGFSKIFLFGHTPAPIDRFGRIQSEIKKTSLGASETMLWEKVEDLTDFLQLQKNNSVSVVALEQTKRSLPLKEFSVPQSVLYVVGNEIDGVSEEVITAADTVVELPMLGEKESLNVSVSAGILMYHGLV